MEFLRNDLQQESVEALVVDGFMIVSLFEIPWVLINWDASKLHTCDLKFMSLLSWATHVASKCVQHSFNLSYTNI